jgi:Ser/Thr protein kinase RdoA (MazF antagonist)
MEALLKKLTELYSPNEPFTASKEVTKGALSINKIISNSSTSFFLKQYRSSLQEDKIREIHTIKSFFYEGGIPVIMPIEIETGSSYFEFEDSFYALFPFINGRQIERSDLTPKALISMAEMLGKIHKIGKQSELNIKSAFRAWNKGNFLERAHRIVETIDGLPIKTEFDLLALKSLKKKINLVLKHDELVLEMGLGRPQLIHGDYMNNNLFFDTKDRVTHVFDFEKANMSPRMYEVIRSMSLVCLHGKPDEKKLNNAALYLRVYHKQFPISKEELFQGLEIYYLKMIHSAWVEEEHYVKHNSRVDLFLESGIESVDYWSEHMQDLTEKLLAAIA